MKLLFAFIAIIVILTAAFTFARSQTRTSGESIPSGQSASSPIPADSQKVEIIASFTIITNGITRNFSAIMYHNRSGDVYIENPDPSVVHVKKKATTWDDFFKTLPMKLTKECLTTGTKEAFCTGDAGTLRFYLNNFEDKDLLDREIKEGDRALIQFSKN